MSTGLVTLSAEAKSFVLEKNKTSLKVPSSQTHSFLRHLSQVATLSPKESEAQR